MIATHERAAAPSKETAAHISKNSPQATESNGRLQRIISSGTTLGWSIFRDPLYPCFGIADIRQRLETKLAACVALDGLGVFPVSHERIRNPHLASIAGAGRILRGWKVGDLAQCHGPLAIPAEGVLVATLESPVWGEDDVQLLSAIERIERLQNLAERSGRTL